MSLYTTPSDFLKDKWLPVFTNQLQNSEGTWLKMLGLSLDSRVNVYEGRSVFMKIQIGDDLGFGMWAEGGDLPTPGDLTPEEATLELARFGSSIRWTGHEMDLLDSLTAAAGPIIQTKLDAARKRVMRELERQAIMDGTGILAKHASDSGATITLDVSGTSYAERNPYTWIDDPNRGRYSLVNPSTGADVTQGWTISGIVRSTNVITTSATQTTGTAADVIVNDYGASAWTSGGSFRSLEMDGLLAMIEDTGTYLGLVRSSVPTWQATVHDNSGTIADLTEDKIDTFLNRVASRSEMGALMPSEYCATASPGVYTSYERLMTSGIRYTVSETPDIGWGGKPYLSLQGIPLYRHTKSPRHEIMLVHKPSVKFVGPAKGGSLFEFRKAGGSMFFPGNASSGLGHSDNTFSYIQGWLGMYTERPRNHGRLTDITETAPDYSPSSY
jgi:hypothetical protein